MPVNREDFQSALAVIDYFVNRRKKEIKLLVSSQNRALLPGNYDRVIIEYGKDNMILSKLPKGSFIKSVANLKYDVVIDLDRESKLVDKAISLAIDANYKLGFDGAFAHKVFNIIFPSDKTKTKGIYQNLINSLTMLQEEV